MPNTNVDERILEMRIDHEKFEAGAKKAISILEKLDKSLDGLNDVGSDGLDKVADSLEIVNKRFSAMGIVGDQVIRNLTNKAMELVGQMTRLGKSLTVDQFYAGWNQYADKTSAVQTIMAATAQEFENQAEQIEVVNAQLGRLITFADETSYSFLDMTSNVGKFTSNGMGLEESVTAMQGISTWAALSGANVSEASRAMYNLSQALATGAVKLIDWKSIENANMATREFKQTALETAVALGTLTKTADGMYKTQAGHIFSIEQFNTQLSDQWFSSDVLMKTLDTYGAFSVVITEAIDDTGMLARDILKALDEYRETGKAAEDLLPWLEKLGTAEMELGERAFRAAQETKTFREMMDATMDAARTKWMTIFELMFGSYLDAKQFWSNAAEEMYRIFVDPLNGLIEIFEQAFGTGHGAGGDLKVFEKALKSAGRTLGDFESAFREIDNLTVDNLIDSYGSLEEAINRGAVGANLFKRVLTHMASSTGSGSIGKAAKSVDEKIEELREIATGVIRGDYGAGEERKRILTELGYDYDMIQWIADTMVGEPQTDTKTLLSRYKPEWLQQIEETASAAGHTDAEIEAMNYMLANAAQLLDDIQAGAEGASGELKTMVQGMSGQALLTGGIQNLLKFFGDLTEIAHNASVALFGGPDAIGTAIHRVLEEFYIFAARIQLGEDRVAELSDTFSTLGGILRYIGSAFMSVVRLGGKIIAFIFNAVKGLLSIIRESGALHAFGQALLTIFGALTVPLALIWELIGNLIKRFRSNVGKKWGSALMTVFTALAEKIEYAANFVKEFFESSAVAEWITDKFAKLEAVINNVGLAFHRIFGPVVLGFKRKGINGALDVIRAKFHWFLKQHPKLAGVFEKIAGWIDKISGVASKGYKAVFDWFSNFDLKNIQFRMPSLQEIIEFFLTMFKNFFTWLGNVLKNLDLSEIVDSVKAAFANVDIFGALSEFFKSVQTFFAEKLGIHLFDTRFFDNIWEFLDGVQEVVLTFGSGALLATFIKMLWNIGDTVGSIGTFVGSITPSVSNTSQVVTDIKGLAKSLLFVAGAVALIAVAAKTISDLPEDKIKTSLAIVTGILGELAAFAFASKFTGAGISKGSGLFLSALSVIILAKMLKYVATLEWDEIQRGLAGVGACVGLIVALSLLSGNINRKGLGQLLKVALGIAVFAYAIKFLSKLTTEEMENGIARLRAIVFQIVLLTLFAGNIKKKGLGDLMKVAIGLVLFVHVIKTLSRMKWKNILKGVLALHLVIGEMKRFLSWRTSAVKSDGLGELIKVALALVVFSLVFKNLSRMNYEQILKGWLGLKALIVNVIALTLFSGSIKDKGLGNLILVAVSLLLFVTVFKALSHMPLKQILTAWIALSIIIGEIGRLTRKLGKITDGKSSFLALLGIVGVLAGIVFALKMLVNEDAKDLLIATVAIVATLSAVALALNQLSKFEKGKASNKGITSLIFIIGSLFAVGWILTKFADYDWKKLGGLALVFVLTMLSLVGMVTYLNKQVGFINVDSFVGLALAIAALGGIGWILTQFADQDPLQMGKIALILVGSLLGIVGVLALLGAGGIGTAAAKGAAALGKIAVVIGLVILAIVGIAALIAGVGNAAGDSIKNFVQLLSDIAATIDNSSISLDTAGKAGLFMAMLGELAVAEVLGLLVGIGAYLNNIIHDKLAPNYTQLITDLEPFIEQVRKITVADVAKTILFMVLLGVLAIAEVFEALVGLGAKLNNIISEKLAPNYTQLIDDIMPFIEKVRLLAWSDLVGIGIFTAILGALAIESTLQLVVAILNYLANLINNNLGLNMSKLAISLYPFVITTRLYTAKDVENAENFVNLMVAIAGASAAEALAAVAQWITDVTGQDVGAHMSTLARKLFPFVLAARLYTDKDAEAAANFVSFMNEVAKASGWEAVAAIAEYIVDLTGEDVAAKMSNLAEKLRPFAEKVYLYSADDASAAANFVSFMNQVALASGWDAIAAIAEYIVDLTGEDVAAKMSNLATNLRSFAEKAYLYTPEDATAVANFVSFMNEVAKASGWEALAGVAQGITDLTNQDVAAHMSSVAIKLWPFILTARGMNENDATKAGYFVGLMKTIAEATFWDTIASLLTKIKGDTNFEKVGSDLKNLADALLPFFETMAKVQTRTVANAKATMEMIAEIGEDSMIESFAQQIAWASDFIDQAKGMGDEINLDNIEQVLDILVSFVNLQTLMEDITKNENKTAIKTSLSDVFKTALSTSSNALDVQTEANKAGENIVKGIALGIDVSHGILQGSMLRLALSAFSFFTNSKYVDSNSPSRAYEVVGGYLVEGLSQGVANNIGVAEDSMTVLGSAVLAAIQQAMLNVATVADDNYEFHPTITPVVDLSNVKSASSDISGAFGGTYGIGAQMSASVNRRINDIERVAASVNGLGGQTINGDNITINVYPSPGQDPESIADAVLNRINSRSIRRGVAFG